MKPNIKSPFLHAWNDPLSRISTTRTCLALCDIANDGEQRLCVCTHDKKLRVYEGISPPHSVSILDLPVALEVLYTDPPASISRFPSLAVAAGSHIFIYRQLKAYKKWTCPEIPMNKQEERIWESLLDDEITPKQAIENLIDHRENGGYLSARSAELITLSQNTEPDSSEEKSSKEEILKAFVDQMKGNNFTQSDIITCMTTINKDTDIEFSQNLLIIGTENKFIYILPEDPQYSNYICRITLPGVPQFLSVSGIFEVEWRITVITREGKIYFVKNGEIRKTAVLVGNSIDLGSPAIALVKQEKNFWVATMNQLVTCYSARGKKLKGIIVPEPVTEMINLPIKRSKLTNILLVALISGDIYLYQDTQKIYSFRVFAPVISMVFGQYGREDNTLIIIHGQGQMTIKMWSRNTNPEQFTQNISGPPAEQNIPIPIPKKTKIFLEQTVREKENAREIHRVFQKDLCKLRLSTARAYVKTLTDGTMMSAVSSGSYDIRIQVQVFGLGPNFQLKITLHNGSQVQTVLNSRLVFNYNSIHYQMNNADSLNWINVPIILPNSKTDYTTYINCIDPLGRAGEITCHLLPSVSKYSQVPILSASIKMPISEPEIL